MFQPKTFVFFEFLSLWFGFLAVYALYSKPHKFWLLPVTALFAYLLLGPLGLLGGAIALFLRYQKR